MRRLRIADTALPIALGILAAALVILRNATHGPGTEGDSIMYLEQIRAISAGTLRHDDYSPPALAALSWLVHQITGLSPIASIGAVNAIAFGLATFIVTFWCRLLGASNLLVLWCGVVCILSPLAYLAASVMTEPLFILALTVTTFSLVQFLAVRGKWFLTLAWCAASCACLTRLAGISAIVAGGVLLLTVPRKSPIAMRVRNCLVYTICAIVPVVAWVILAGLPVDRPSEGSFGMSYTFSIAVNTIADWTFGRAAVHGPSTLAAWTDLLPPELRSFAMLGILLAFFAPPLLTFAFLAKEPPSGLRLSRETRQHLALTLTANATFLVVYALVIVLLLWASGIGAQPRYFLPLYLPALVVLTLVLQSHFHYARRLISRVSGTSLFALKSIATIGVLVAIVAWQCLRLPIQFKEELGRIQEHFAHGQGFTSSLWRNSDTIAFARERIPPGAVVYTNQISAFIVNVDPNFERLSVHDFTSARWAELARLLSTSASQVDALSERPIYMVWFHEIPERIGWPYGQLGPCETQQLLESRIEETQSFQVMGAFDDGMVFRIGKPGTPMREIVVAAGDGLVGSHQPFHRSTGVDVYLAERRVVYRVGTSRDCPCGDLRFILRITPVNPADLPELRIVHGHTDEYLDWMFEREERYIKTGCAVVIPLPDYEVQSLKTGNWIRDENGLWVATEWEAQVQLR